ncbi:MAG: hypothetical protein IKY90_05365 [Oscillospiraceae bacterium]|nr:hypothetical protein [Oscillospiraceae bacterium]
MRKLIALILIFSILLCGCTTGHTDSVPHSSSVVERSTVSRSSSEKDAISVSRTSSVYDKSSQTEPDSEPSNSQNMNSTVNDNISDEKTNYFVKYNFFTEDASKSNEYNKAIKLYNDYMIKKLENWSYKDDFCYDDDVVTGYCLYDFENDGIPELLVRYGSPILAEAEVYTYVNGDIVHSWVGDMCILKNGMIGYRRVGTYHRYTFCKHNADGTFSNVLKLEEVHMGKETENEFYIDEVQVSKEEYFSIADKWIEEYEESYYPPYKQIEEVYKMLI